MKQCTKCKEEKPATPEYFRRNKNNKDGLSHQCKACFKVYEDEYIKRREVREKRIVYMNEYNYKPGTRDRHNQIAQTPEYKAKQRALRQRPEQMAKDRARKLTAEAKARHRELEQRPEAKARRREQSQTPQGKARIARKAAKREGIIRELPNTLNKHDVARMTAFWQARCAYCGRHEDVVGRLHLDHFVPVTASHCPGTVAENMLPACGSCNSSKSDNVPAYWLAKRFGDVVASEIMERIEAYFAWVKAARED